MKLRSLVQDALYLNWALPAADLPAPPAPLRYQVRDEDGVRWAFASALLFRHRGIHLPHLPVVRFSYPQMNLRLYAVDGDGVPCVLFREMLMPWWVGPAVRWVTEQPASAARFDYPRPSRDPAAEAWSWRVEQGGRLTVAARRGVPGTGAGPTLGSWAKTVRFFRERPRGYLLSGDRLRRIETEHPSVPVWPVVAEVRDDSLLQSCLPLADGWPALHSAWLCPRIPFVFDLAIVPEVELEATLPQAAASTRSGLASAIFRRP
jgi:hypothetical protein